MRAFIPSSKDFFIEDLKSRHGVLINSDKNRLPLETVQKWRLRGDLEFRIPYKVLFTLEKKLRSEIDGPVGEP